MGVTDGTSINTNCLACMWKVEMEKGDSIKEEGGYGIRDWKRKGKTL